MEHIVCYGLIVALLGVNYALTNRLIRQSGMRTMAPTEVLEKTVGTTLPNEPIVHPKAVSGRMKIRA